MGSLTGTTHGDQANLLFAFYQESAKALARNGQFYMAAVTLGLAAEAALVAYILVEFGDDASSEIKVPSDIGFAQLIEAARELDVLSAPINIPSHVDGESPPAHVATDIIDNLRQLRNLIHPAKALQMGFDPRSFSESDYKSYRSMYESILHSLMYNL